MFHSNYSSYGTHHIPIYSYASPLYLLRARPTILGSCVELAAVLRIRDVYPGS